MLAVAEAWLRDLACFGSQLEAGSLIEVVSGEVFNGNGNESITFLELRLIRRHFG